MSRWLSYDAADMHAHFEREPFTIRHQLVGHPLLQLPRIVELAKFLSPVKVEFNSGAVAVSQDYLSTPKTGLTAEQTLRQIEQTKSWMVLKNVERDPEYAELLQECLKQLAEQTESIAPGMCWPEAFVFVSSPGSITPYHIDPEHNFLLQILGTKQITVCDRNDRRLLSEVQLEKFYAGAHRNLDIADELAKTGQAFALTPGVGVHVPVNAPHWVRNGDAVSVSFSITFRSKSSRDRAGFYRINSMLRRRGMTPRPPGQSAVVDSIKVLAARAAERLEYLRLKLSKSHQ